MNSLNQKSLTEIVETSRFIEFRCENNCEPSHNIKPDSDDDFLTTGYIDCPNIEADVRVILHPKTTPADAVRSLIHDSNKLTPCRIIFTGRFYVKK